MRLNEIEYSNCANQQCIGVHEPSPREIPTIHGTFHMRSPDIACVRRPCKKNQWPRIVRFAPNSRLNTDVRPVWFGHVVWIVYSHTRRKLIVQGSVLGANTYRFKISPILLFIKVRVNTFLYDIIHLIPRFRPVGRGKYYTVSLQTECQARSSSKEG